MIGSVKRSAAEVYVAFLHPFTVRFSEIDAAGIVFFGTIFDYCHRAYEALLVAGGLPLEHILEGDWAMPLIHAEADFKRPMFLGENLLVEVSIERVGRSSLTYRHRILDQQGNLRATAQLVHVTTDTKTFVSRPLPESLLESLRALELLPVVGD